MIHDPAAGALPPCSDKHLKLAKALKRAARRIAFRLYVQYLFFELQLFALKSRLALVKALRNVFRLFHNSSFYIGAHASRVVSPGASEPAWKSLGYENEWEAKTMGAVVVKERE